MSDISVPQVVPRVEVAEPATAHILTVEDIARLMEPRIQRMHMAIHEQLSLFENQFRINTMKDVEAALEDETFHIPGLEEIKNFKVQSTEDGGQMTLREAVRKAYKLASKNKTQVWPCRRSQCVHT